MLVRDKQSARADVEALSSPRWLQMLRFTWERLVIWLTNGMSKKNLFAVDAAFVGDDVTKTKVFKEADVIHLHWVNQGMLSLRGLRKILESDKPVVWTMHDMWACTSICHHARECQHYVDECSHCPYLRFPGNSDLSNSVFHKKASVYALRHISFVACSKWLCALAENSALLRAHHVSDIPNPIDPGRFCLKDKVESRKKLGLPTDRNLILFGAVKTTDKRKGIDYMVEACRLFCMQNPQLSKQCGIVVFGNKSEELDALLPLPVISVGYVADEARMAELYAAADLFVTPSLEENLPNTIMEALVCGTPCVGFSIGGIPEMIRHKKNGYVAAYKDAQDFANGMAWVMEEGREVLTPGVLRADALSRYAPSVVAEQYVAVYEQALREAKG